MAARRVRRPATPARRASAAGRALRDASLRALAAGTLLSLAAAALAQTESQVTLTRKDTTIVVTLKAQYADGARFIGNNPNCQSGMRQTLLYGPDPGYVDTRVGNDTELRSNVAIVLSPDATAGGNAAGGNAAGGNAAGGNAAGGNAGSGNVGGDAAGGGTAGGGAAGGTSGGASGGPADAAPTTAAGEDQTLELYDGTVTLDRPGCIDTEQRTQRPSVTLVQGRTTVKGTRFFLDQGSDTGTMDGPIELVRAAAGDSPSLTATADSMQFDTQTRHATLLGNVKVTSQDRVTTADSLELDEAAGVALLAGSPAKSTKGKDVLEGSRLRYYLNNNDVVVLGKVHGDLEVNIP